MLLYQTAHISKSSHIIHSFSNSVIQMASFLNLDCQQLLLEWKLI